MPQNDKFTMQWTPELHAVVSQYGYNSKEYRDAYNKESAKQKANYKYQQGEKVSQAVSKTLDKVGKEYAVPAVATIGSLALGAGSLASKGVNEVAETSKFLLQNPQILQNLARGILTGAGIDLSYETITGKPAQVGEALDVSNPYTRTALNFISPGSLFGSSFVSKTPSISVQQKVSNKVLHDTYEAYQKYAKLKNFSIPEKSLFTNGSLSEGLDRLRKNVISDVTKHETYYRGIDASVTPSVQSFLESLNIKNPNSKTVIENLLARVPPSTGAGRKGLPINTDKASGSYATRNLGSAINYATHPETLNISMNPIVGKVQRKIDFSQPTKSILDQALKVDYNVPEIANVDKLLKTKTQHEFMQTLKSSSLRNPIIFSNTEKKLFQMGKNKHQLHNMKEVIKNTPNNYFVLQPGKYGENVVNLGNPGEQVWNVLGYKRVLSLKDLSNKK